MITESLLRHENDGDAQRNKLRITKSLHCRVPWLQRLCSLSPGWTVWLVRLVAVYGVLWAQWVADVCSAGRDEKWIIYSGCVRGCWQTGLPEKV